MSAIDLVILSLASGRIAFSLVRDDIFQWLRALIMRIDWRRHEDVSLTGLFNCFYCLSFWVSIVLVSTYMVFNDAGLTLATPFAVWGAANLIAKGLDNG